MVPALKTLHCLVLALCLQAEFEDQEQVAVLRFLDLEPQF